MQQFWQWVLDSTASGRSAVLALPRLQSAGAAAMLELPAGTLADAVSLRSLPTDSPVPGVVIEVSATSLPREEEEEVQYDEALIRERTCTWVQRTLAPGPLSFCPYTSSAQLAGTGLEALGVGAAPIAYGVCASARLDALLADFWGMADAMVRSGEDGTSSILLMAPAWDARWDAWREDVFPALEASLLAAGLGRTLGIVCFHPCYETPDESWLARHRFGHMHSTTRLRRWVRAEDAALSERVSDDELQWAGSYQRRTPHATINVLWARQLEVAETKRDSASLYTRNVRRCLAAGLENLHESAQRERETL